MQVCTWLVEMLGASFDTGSGSNFFVILTSLFTSVFTGFWRIKWPAAT
ncbi:hypothetical protein PNIG_a1251 [Pseudoalteromonas nigrifaciens]|uniref:Uncharacterized protein n=2 Tax=Pseudoalteromonas TaxID=53246 RepID=A0AAC9UHB2_9GAMM|nr:hypothetical protein PTRA_a1187 [Pseudoalteromonas translucida KMM 520]ASM53439.1 hypothetical protein PNIG_a1251 [Pseudoalteromonas nigrifaciens]SJN48168.1 hypothetical protein CZ797_16045 [Pseudoalteromonas sp. JB197]